MLYLLNIRACSTSDSELEHMNAEYMMHGFLHVPNASASRAAHVNLKRSQGVCLILEFLHISLRSLAPLAHLVSTISRMSSKCCNITYFLCEYTVFCLHRLLCAARMNFEQLLLEFLSSTIWTATIAKHWYLTSAWHQLFLSV